MLDDNRIGQAFNRGWPALAQHLFAPAVLRLGGAQEGGGSRERRDEGPRQRHTQKCATRNHLQRTESSFQRVADSSFGLSCELVIAGSSDFPFLVLEMSYWLFAVASGDIILNPADGLGERILMD
jgi:hypothetical protein